MLVTALFVGIAWSLASPPGSAPDDDWHLASIWCAPGASTENCRSVPDRPKARLVPAEVAGATCFAQDPTKSGACQNGQDGVLTPDSRVTKGNWRHAYPPVFYLAMHPFVTGDFYASVVLMRVANSVLAILAVALLMVLLPRRLRVLAALPLLLTSIPLGISLLASTNPSSWTLVSAATLWVALYGSFETEGRSRHLLWVYALAVTVIGAGSRADSALFCILAAGIVLLLRLPVLRRERGGVLVLLLCVVTAGIFFVASGQSAAVSSGFAPGSAGSAAPSAIELTVANVQQLPVLWAGGFGFGFMGSIGWLDTVFPPLVSFLTLSVWAGVVFAALRLQSRLKALALVTLGAALTVYPLYLLAKSHLPVGQGFQPRYVLPILVMLTGVCLLGGASTRFRLSGTQASIVVASLSLAHLIALYTQIRRYVTGADSSGLDLDQGREWWWSWPVSAMAVWIVGSAAFVVLCAGLVRLVLGDASLGGASEVSGDGQVAHGLLPPAGAPGPRSIGSGSSRGSDPAGQPPRELSPHQSS